MALAVKVVATTGSVVFRMGEAPDTSTVVVELPTRNFTLKFAVCMSFQCERRQRARRETTRLAP